MDKKLVKVTIVSGFLGAGKTTLLRQMILRSIALGEHSVVIENEFGAVGLDAAVLAQSGIDVHELNQGCICCTLKTDFAATLTAILETEPPPDRIFFEPSGIFIPDGVLEILEGPEFLPLCRLESLITVVDALGLAKGNPMFQDFLKRQTRYADHLAVSKAQNLEEAGRAALLSMLAGLNLTAQLCFADPSGMGSEILDALFQTTLEDRLARKPRFQPKTVPGHGLEMVSLALPENSVRPKLEECLQSLSEHQYGKILRAKGRTMIEGAWNDVSWVDGALTFTELAGRSAAADLPSWRQLVVIGSHLDQEKLRNLFL